MKKFADIILIMIALIWGSGFIFSQMALDANLSPFVIMTIRFTIAALLLGMTCFKKIKQFSAYELKAGLITGFFLYISFAFQTIGLQYTTPSSNAFLTATNVVIVPLIYWLFYKKSPGKPLILGSILAIIGIGLLTIKKDFSIGIGDSLSLVCAFLFAAHVVCIGHFSQKVGVEKLSFLQMGVAAILSCCSMGILEQQQLLEIQFTTKGIMAVVYLGIMSTCVAFFLQTYAQKYTSPVKTSIFLSMEALFATVFSVLLGYENFSVKMILGGLCVFSAAIVAEIGPLLWEKIKNIKTVCVERGKNYD
ncbi:MAG: DMT family transporter [Cellulosilyticaceae bacterium]